MSVEELKKALSSLSAGEQNEISAFLFLLRHHADTAYQTEMTARMADKDRAHWLTPEEFEQQLDAK